jgi:DNA-binding CsgD family transcriptional regulator
MRPLMHHADRPDRIAFYKGLTKGEIRLSYLIRQKMNNKEIATVLNVSPTAVEKAKYRLKKKITLEKDESLDAYIQQL